MIANQTFIRLDGHNTFASSYTAECQSLPLLDMTHTKPVLSMSKQHVHDLRGAPLAIVILARGCLWLAIGHMS